MYGLINKAVEGLVRSKFGDATWDRIRTRAGLPDEPFIGMEQYPDKTTYDLVGAASAELGASADAILEEFGVYSPAPKKQMVGFNFLPDRRTKSMLMQKSREELGYEAGLGDAYGLNPEQFAEMMNGYLDLQTKPPASS